MAHISSTKTPFAAKAEIEVLIDKLTKRQHLVIVQSRTDPQQPKKIEKILHFDPRVTTELCTNTN